MPSALSLAFIGLGTPVPATPSVTILGIGEAGTLGARRVLTHPDAANFPPITYYKNPDYDFNLDNDVLGPPLTKLQRTLSGAQLIRFDRPLIDQVVTEVWEGDGSSRASMPSFQLRQFIEYLKNPPTYDPLAQTYFQWQPRDRNPNSYNVELLSLTGGGGTDRRGFKMRTFRLAPGLAAMTPLDSLDVPGSGLYLETVELQLRIVSVVA